MEFCLSEYHDFNFKGNPSTGIADLSQSGNGIYFTENGTPIDPNQASVSWWLLFVCVSISLIYPAPLKLCKSYFLNC